jgi:hypothetical protein
LNEKQLAVLRLELVSGSGYGAEFYEALRADPKRPLADVVRSIRSRAYRGYAPKDSYASYVFFGDPLAT